jgi:hypothetical protein
LYPAAFPLALVTLLWAAAALNPLDLVRPLVVTGLGSVVVIAVLSVLAGHARLGAIGATAVFVGLLLSPVILALTCAMALIIAGMGRRWNIGESRVAAIGATVLRLVATIAVITTLIYVAQRPDIGSLMAEAFLAPPGPAERPQPAAGAPDIFVYLLDAYPGRTASARQAAFDATVFSAALTARGFTVHDDARTNYLVTRLVISSMFAEQHIEQNPQLAAPYGVGSGDARRLRWVLEHSAGLDDIRSAGYDVVWVSSGWSHLDIRNVDRWIEAPGPSEFEKVLLHETAVGSLVQFINPNGYAAVTRTRVRAAYDVATAIAAESHERPRFVFVHVPSPHVPIAFRADGSPRDDDPGISWNASPPRTESDEDRRSRTFDQVAAIAQMTIDGVDAVRSAAAVEPVIVVFSDHGTDIGWDETHPLESDLGERSSSFLATSTPGHPQLFAEPTTPINIIGTLTNAYFGTTVARQADVTFAYEGSLLNVVPIDTTRGN